MVLLFHNLQNLHGASLDADATGDALGGGAFVLENHHLHGAGLHALAAADAELLVDHVHAGLGVLGNSTMLAGTHALTALDADIGLCLCTLGDDLDAAQIGIKFLVKSIGTSPDTFQTSHALFILLDSQLLHTM